MELTINKNQQKLKINNLHILTMLTILISTYLALNMSISLHSYDGSFLNEETGVTSPIFAIAEIWMMENLGKLLTLIGFLGTFLVYTMTHKTEVLFFGIIVSLISGGMVGISSTFFDAGSAHFEMSAVIPVIESVFV